MQNDLLVMLKVAERCNINCSYCYMYQGVDQRWRDRPKFLDAAHFERVIERLHTYRKSYPSARMTLEIHGGEPLLLGKRRTTEFFGALRKKLLPRELAIVMQTNGTLLDGEWLDIFSAHNATLGISCDGPPAAHDRHRIDFAGNGSSKNVERAIQLCLTHPKGRSVFNGVLAVIDPNNDPQHILNYFRDLGVRDIDLLLPDAHHAAAPRHIEAYSHDKLSDFLCRAFDAWIALDDPRFLVRIFETFVRGVLGMRSELDAFGGVLSPIVVIESDGSYRLLDVLSICKDGASHTGLHVSTHELHEFVSHARNRYPEACDVCQRCPAFTACGGGYAPHRFDGGSYDNPSFYCEPLFALYQHVKTYLEQLLMTPAASAAANSARKRTPDRLIRLS